jgi:hypothetical protein
MTPFQQSDLTRPTTLHRIDVPSFEETFDRLVDAIKHVQNSHSWLIRDYTMARFEIDGQQREYVWADLQSAGVIWGPTVVREPKRA